MGQVESICFWIAVCLYAFSTAIFWLGWIFEKENLLRLIFCAVWAGLLSQAVAIGLHWQAVGHGPYISRSEILTSNAWVLLFIYLLVQYRVPRIRPAGALVIPGVLLMSGLASSCSPNVAPLPATFGSGWLVLHIGFAKLAYGSLGLASILSFFFLLKDGKPPAEQGFLARLPEPADLDRLIYRLTLLGFMAIAVMIGAGMFWAHKAWARYWGWDPIEVWALITWLVYALCLHLRRTRGWRGRKAAWLTLGAFVFVVIQAFAITTLAESIHANYFVK